MIKITVRNAPAQAHNSSSFVSPEGANPKHQGFGLWLLVAILGILWTLADEASKSEHQNPSNPRLRRGERSVASTVLLSCSKLLALTLNSR